MSGPDAAVLVKRRRLDDQSLPVPSACESTADSEPAAAAAADLSCGAPADAATLVDKVWRLLSCTTASYSVAAPPLADDCSTRACDPPATLGEAAQNTGNVGDVPTLLAPDDPREKQESECVLVACGPCPEYASVVSGSEPDCDKSLAWHFDVTERALCFTAPPPLGHRLVVLYSCLIAHARSGSDLYMQFMCSALPDETTKNHDDFATENPGKEDHDIEESTHGEHSAGLPHNDDDDLSTAAPLEVWIRPLCAEAEKKVADLYDSVIYCLSLQPDDSKNMDSESDDENIPQWATEKFYTGSDDNGDLANNNNDDEEKEEEEQEEEQEEEEEDEDEDDDKDDGDGEIPADSKE